MRLAGVAKGKSRRFNTWVKQGLRAEAEGHVLIRMWVFLTDHRGRRLWCGPMSSPEQQHPPPFPFRGQGLGYSEVHPHQDSLGTPQAQNSPRCGGGPSVGEWCNGWESGIGAATGGRGGVQVRTARAGGLKGCRGPHPIHRCNPWPPRPGRWRMAPGAGRYRDCAVNKSEQTSKSLQKGFETAAGGCKRTHGTRYNVKVPCGIQTK
ncbi:hypothetical protein F5144DRAFT_204957 [Chaetomium tenue]|uniref:Uncharacterized protein n=1 Tax=Chaetomium tenue TaxID=1854479 RepID=A0ACB7PHB1_9PEZI|nr:hypothetical protein F5144DRAFT_204957 [Chaetomium globosum]